MPERKTVGQLMEEMRLKAGAQNYHGHEYMDLQRFAEDTRHMIIFDVLTNDSPVGWKGERTRLFLSDTGYEKALDSQEKGQIKILSHAKVRQGKPRLERIETDILNNFKRLGVAAETLDGKARLCKLVFQHIPVFCADRIESVLLCRDIDRLFRFAALRPLIDERELHRNGSVKVVEEVAPVLKNGGLVVCLCKLIVNIFKGDGL